MSRVTEITSVSQWNTTLREAKAANPPKTIIVDWYAVWCGPCKVIAPYFEQEAAANPRTVFVRVDVEGENTRAISTNAKYKITSMPTFTAIKDGGVVDRMSGADARALLEMVQKHGTPANPPLPAEAEAAKSQGNKAFTSGEYLSAIQHYTKAIEHAPNSAVLYTNRSYAHLKQAQKTFGTPEHDSKIGANATKDANKATELDEYYTKAWVRLAEAFLFTAKDDAGVEESEREKGRQFCMAAAIESLETAARLAEQERNTKLKTEVQQMLNSVKSGL